MSKAPVQEKIIHTSSQYVSTMIEEKPVALPSMTADWYDPESFS
jgi:hypothetical protein